VYDFADKFHASHPDLRRVSPVALKEALLDHANIPDDPLGYTGLADEDARRQLACIAAHVVADSIWGDLALRRGPDERHLREAHLAIRGLRTRLAEAEHDLRQYDDRIAKLNPDATVTAREVQARTIHDRRVSELRYDIDRWTQRARELEQQTNWIALADDQPLADPAELRRTILTETTTPPFIRDWLTQHELAKLFGKSSETLRR
jgi:hypothetical protein